MNPVVARVGVINFFLVSYDASKFYIKRISVNLESTDEIKRTTF